MTRMPITHQIASEALYRSLISSSSANATSIQGVPVSPAAPANGDVLEFNGTDWIPFHNTVAFVDDVSSPYTATTTDTMIEADVSGGSVTVHLAASPIAGVTRQTVKNSAGDASIQPVLIDGNGFDIEDPSSPGTFSAGTVSITSKGGAATWLFDSLRWVFVY